MIQQAIAQILTPIYEPQFSETSFGFRPKRGAHDALKTCQRYADEGYVYVVDMDLEKFFDTVCQSKLIEILWKETVSQSEPGKDQCGTYLESEVSGVRLLPLQREMPV